MLIHRSSFLLAFLIGLSLLGSGCATTSEFVFEGQKVEPVWDAMLIVARTPDYRVGAPNDRWIVRENRVWTDRENRRIEIFRRLERVRYEPASNPRYEKREWKFQVAMQELEPPNVTVAFSSRELGVPSHAWAEADRFFGDVMDVLYGRRRETPPLDATPPPPPVGG